VLGAALLLAGSTVGAGALALPQVAAPAGFPATAVALTGAWGLLTAEALLLAEVCLTMMRERNIDRGEHGRSATSSSISLRAMAGRTLGPWGSACVAPVYVLSSLALLVAYIAKAGEVLGGASGLPREVAGGLFAAALGGMMFAGGTAVTDRVNRPLIGALLALFLGVVVSSAPAGHYDFLLEVPTGALGSAASALPVFFLALTYHDLVPVVCSYLDSGDPERDAPRVRAALLLGGGLPFLLYLSWSAATMALVPPGAEVDPLAELTSGSLGVTAAACAEGFSMLALVTSFLGTTLGFSEFLVAEVRDISAGAATRTRLQLPRPVQAWWLRSGLRGTAFAAALAPPTLIAAAQPDIFLDATLAAGAYGNALLYGVVPPLMVHALRRAGLTGSTRPGPFAALGLPVRGLPAQGLLASTAGASGFIVLRQAWSDTEGLLGTTQEPQGVLAEASTGLVSAVVNGLPVGAPPWPWQ
jgi:tyrosine-specific transport protein